MPLPRSSPPLPAVVLMQALVLAVLPHGGQRNARRNAWAGMAADASRARSRRDAEAALAASGATSLDWSAAPGR